MWQWYCKYFKHENIDEIELVDMSKKCKFQVGDFIKMKDPKYSLFTDGIIHDNILLVIGVSDENHNIKVVSYISSDESGLYYRVTDSRMFIKLSEDEIRNIPKNLMQLFTNFIKDTPGDLQLQSLVRFRSGYDEMNDDDSYFIQPMMVINIKDDEITIAGTTTNNQIDICQFDKTLLCLN